MCPLKSKTVPGIVPESSFDIAGPSRFLPPAILTIFSCAGYRGHRLHQKQRHLILFSFVDPVLIRTRARTHKSEKGHVLGDVRIALRSGHLGWPSAHLLCANTDRFCDALQTPKHNDRRRCAHTTRFTY